MAAVIPLRPNHQVHPAQPRVRGAVAPAMGRLAPAAPQGPTLRLVQGGRSDRALQMRRTFILRRLAVVSVAVVVAVVAFNVVGAVVSEWASPAVAAAQVPSIKGSTYQVRSGDTLWSIAAALDPTSDPRAVIERIAEANARVGIDLSAGSLRAGQEIALPG